jgi:hypothetical protein
MRILVTGSRDWLNTNLVVTALEMEAFGNDNVTVVHGGNPTGADAAADRWARDRNVKVEVHKPQWAKLGLKAGPLRNQQMVRRGADVCLAFIRNNSAGASDCARKAEAAGIPTNIYREGDQA